MSVRRLFYRGNSQEIPSLRAVLAVQVTLFVCFKSKKKESQKEQKVGKRSKMICLITCMNLCVVRPSYQILSSDPLIRPSHQTLSSDFRLCCFLSVNYNISCHNHGYYGVLVPSPELCCTHKSCVSTLWQSTTCTTCNVTKTMVFALIITMIEETRRQIRLQSNASGLSMVSDRSSLVCCTKTDSSSSLISCSTLKTQLETTRRSLSTSCSLVHIYIYIYLLLKVNMAVTFLILPLELLFWSRARAFLSIEKQASLFLVPIQFWVPIFLVLFLFPEKLVHCIKGCCCWCLVEIRERKISRLDPFWCQRKLKKSISLSRKYEREIRCSLFLRILFFSC